MPDRDEAARLADHAQIEGLADELLPALIAKLGATGLAELEVREGDWKVRLRRSADGSTAASRAASARAARPAGGHLEHAHPAGAEAAHGPYRLAATSPAVGIYHPRPEISSGSRVRSRRPDRQRRRAGHPPGGRRAGQRDRRRRAGRERRRRRVRPGAGLDRADLDDRPSEPGGTPDVLQDPDRQPGRDRRPDPARLPDPGRRGGRGLQRGRPREPGRPAGRRGDLHRPGRCQAELPARRRP